MLESFIVILDRYLFKQLVSRITIIIAITIMILFLEHMLTLFQTMIKMGGPVFVVFQMLLFQIPNYMGLGLSIGLLLGIMLVFRKLAQDQELVSSMACRYSPMRLMRMPILLGVIFCLLNFLLQGYLRPEAEYQYSKLGFDVRHGAFGVALKAGEFTKLGPGMTLYTEKVGSGGGDLTSIFLEIQDEKGNFTYVSASTGSFIGSQSDENILIFQLKDGRLITSSQADQSKPQTLVFDVFDLPIRLPDIPGFRDRSMLKEMGLGDLLAGSSKADLSREERMQMEGEAHKRIVLSLLPLVIPFMAVALAVPPPRKSSPVGIIVALGLLIAIFKTLDFAVLQVETDPKLIIYPALAIYLLLTVRFYYVFAYTVGKEPLGSLSTFVDYGVSLIVSYFKRRQPA